MDRVPKNGDDVGKLRAMLDDLDTRLIDQLARRFRLVDRLAAAKRSTGRPIRDRTRENEVLRRAEAHATARGICPRFTGLVFEEIFEHAVRRQRESRRARVEPLTLAYQGEPGAYSQLAAQRYAGRAGFEPQTVGMTHFADVARAVSRGDVACGVLPFENSTTGLIGAVADLLIDTELAVVAELVQPVNHVLLGLPGATLDGVAVVHSHPQALAQCRRFLNALTRVEIEAIEDTAAAARRVRERGDPTHAAIASRDAARRHGLAVLEGGVADQTDNHTRFLVLARELRAVPPDERLKLALVVEPHPGAGDLAWLAPLSQVGFRVETVERRPRPDVSWSYRYLVEVGGISAETEISACIDRIRRVAGVRVVGRYAAAPRG